VFDVVLIALDNRPFDHQVMAAVQQLQLNDGATVVFAHVLPYAEDTAGQDVSRPLPADHEFPHSQIERHLQACAAQLPDVASVFEIVQGDAETEILRLANIHQASLIVLGSRGLTGVDRILAGSVSSQVVAEAACTVMVVKSPANADEAEDSN
jgi:nucleotide-binding universal stress UspA family protein